MIGIESLKSKNSIPTFFIKFLEKQIMKKSENSFKKVLTNLYVQVIMNT